MFIYFYQRQHCFIILSFMCIAFGLPVGFSVLLLYTLVITTKSLISTCYHTADPLTHFTFLPFPFPFENHNSVLCTCMYALFALFIYQVFLFVCFISITPGEFINICISQSDLFPSVDLEFANIYNPLGTSSRNVSKVMKHQLIYRSSHSVSRTKASSVHRSRSPEHYVTLWTDVCFLPQSESFLIFQQQKDGP